MLKKARNNMMLNKKTNTLLGKILISAKMYRKAAEHVHFEQLSEDFLKVAMQREQYFLDCCVASNADPDKFKLSTGEQVKFTFEKLMLAFDDIVIKNNHNEMRFFCPQRDQELVEADMMVIPCIVSTNPLYKMLEYQMHEVAQEKKSLELLVQEESL